MGAALKPDGRPRRREVLVGRKWLPDPQEHERARAFVARVVDSAAELREHLEAKKYGTRTRGTRVAPGLPE